MEAIISPCHRHRQNLVSSRSIIPGLLLCGIGIDSPKECTGEKFECTWEQGKNALIRIYKDLKDGKGISVRTERQGYPNKRFDLAIEEKLNALGSSRLRNRYVVSRPYVLSYYYIIMSHMGSSFVVCSSTRQN